MTSRTSATSRPLGRIALAGLAAAALLAESPAPLSAQAIQRSMTVSVVDDAGAPVPDLKTTDVVVREDNVAREVLKVAPATEPMQIALIVDNSAKSRDNITHFRSALPAFVTALTNPNGSGVSNQVAILASGERPTILTTYTSNAAELQRGINRIFSQPDSGAYLLDTISEVCTGFKKREATRPVIVAISQEGRELSYRGYDQVLDPLRGSGATFYALAIGTPSGRIDDETRSRAIVLDQGTRDTGGAHELLLTPMALAGALTKLAAVLTHQYLVTYAHPDSLIPPDRVTVAAAKPGMTARGTLVKDQVSQGRR